MKNFILSVIFMAISLQSSIGLSASMTGHEGNGGDAIEAFFIQTGSDLLARLSRTPEGQKFLKELPVSLPVLTATLDHSRITVSDDRLYDSTGAEVDAKFENGVVYLSRKNWLEHLILNTQTELLVFHEMLRSAGVNDDNYRYSKDVGLFSDLTDPREAMSLSQYINSNAVRMHVTDRKMMVPLTTFAFVNNFEAKVEISGISLKNKNSIRKNQDKTYSLSIPVNGGGEKKIVVYRVDYEYIGYLTKDAILRSQREVRFQSATAVVSNDQQFSTTAGKTMIVTDLIDLESPYKESLQIRVKNHIESPGDDTVSSMVLNRVTVYFNILRL